MKKRSRWKQKSLNCPSTAEFTPQEHDKGDILSSVKQLCHSPSATTEDKIIGKSGPHPSPTYVDKLTMETPQNTFCSKPATKNLPVPASVTMKQTLHFQFPWIVWLDTFPNGGRPGWCMYHHNSTLSILTSFLPPTTLQTHHHGQNRDRRVHWLVHHL